MSADGISSVSSRQCSPHICLGSRRPEVDSCREDRNPSQISFRHLTKAMTVGTAPPRRSLFMANRFLFDHARKEIGFEPAI